MPTRFGHAGPRAQLELMIHHHEAPHDHEHSPSRSNRFGTEYDPNP